MPSFHNRQLVPSFCGALHKRFAQLQGQMQWSLWKEYLSCKDLSVCDITVAIDQYENIWDVF
ncbi:hypothetical protein SNOG_16324 [Parastagonospora nodorum SN15]|uniref:Uncharacterized protein n=1 Tax=Phaeosphaeria nodorum (strain SN15 / ATCC MYA-4574 / FGSC 10173) TaxID=321614 RepID=Q0TW05_PHANO|nr:hypothetical protein SNOG_16324 [Parastagonospora nodorum SN15]EAT76310.1 hypothetical protein SNOG_16324 [Parastagonospora nodorum SN15]